MSKKTIELETLLKHASVHDLHNHVESIQGLTFSSYIDTLLDRYQLSKSNLIQRTHIDRTYAYQLLQGKKRGSKDKIIQFVLAMHCSLEECNRLLLLSDHGKLYAKQKRDSILIYAIETKMDIFATNELLLEFQEDCLQ